jgi:hypothetical protein
MKMKSEIRWLLIGITATMFMLLSLAVVADKTVYLPIIGNATGYKIGDTGLGGGTVFFVSSNGLHGLEAALSEARVASVRWNNGAYTNTEAHGNGVGAGEMNTMLIIANQGSDSYSYAAGRCANLAKTNGDVDYSDWYLPSRVELNLLYLQKTIVGGFGDYFYWSSTEQIPDMAWYQNFTNGFQGLDPKERTHKIRCVRAF